MARRRQIQSLVRALLVIVVAGLVGITLVAVRAIAVSHQAASRAATADLAALEDAHELQALLYQKGFVAEYLLTGDERWIEELRRATPEFEKWLARITVDASDERSGAAASALVAEYGRYDAGRERAIAEYRAGDRAGATRTLVESNTASAARLRELAERLIRIRGDEIRARLEQANRTWEHTLIALAATVVLAIVFSAGVGFFVARRVGRPLFELVLRAESAAGGARIEVKSDDEIGALSEHVAHLARRIEESSTALAEHRTRLQQAEKMSALGAMATTLAHEVLNPLAGIKAAMQLLARTRPIDDVVDTARSIDAEVRRVETLARRLVVFARPLAPEKRRCDLDEVCQRVAQATRVEAAANGVTVEQRLDGVRAIDADPDLLVQVLVNLTANACQAMAGGGRVRIRARRDEAWAVIDVEDEGPGLPAEVAARLFTPFVTTRPDGHGLGLAISQNIAIAHGGRIEVRSNAPRAGITFAVILPTGAA